MVEPKLNKFENPDKVFVSLVDELVPDNSFNSSSNLSNSPSSILIFEDELLRFLSFISNSIPVPKFTDGLESSLIFNEIGSKSVSPKSIDSIRYL